MADISITATNSASGRPYVGPNVVFVDDDIGYVFYWNSSSLDIVYRKTTNGGSSWGSEVVVRAGTVTLFFSVWADWWTPGDTGTKIHIAYVDSTPDDCFYRYLDTNGDSLGTEQTVFSGTSAALNGFTSITKTRGGKLAIATMLDAGAEMDFATSPDGTTWTSKATVWESAVDYLRLFPANLADSNDLWALFVDVSANELSLKTFDDSANSWSETSIAASMNGSAVNVASTIQFNFDGVVRHSDGHLLVAAWNAFDVSTADLQTWDITDASTITAKTNVITDSDDCAVPALFINQGTGAVYCGYIGKSDGSETYGTSGTTKIYYKLSTDGMATWGSEAAYSENTGSRILALGSSASGGGSLDGRFYLAWMDITATSLLGGFTNSVSIAASSGASGTLAATMKKLTTSLSGAQTQSGTIAATMKKAVASLSGVMQPQGTIAASMQHPTAALIGAQIYAGLIAAEMQSLEASLSGEAGVATGAIAATLKAAVASLEGYEAPSGAIAASLQHPTASLSGAQIMTGALAVTLKALLFDGAGVHGVFTGTLAGTMQPLQASMAGIEHPRGQLAASMQSLDASLTGQQIITGTLAAVMKALLFSGSGAQTQTGTIAVTMQAPEAALSGAQTQSGVVAVTMKPLQFAGQGAQPYTGIIAAALAQLVFAGSGSGGEVVTFIRSLLADYLPNRGSLASYTPTQRLQADYAPNRRLKGDA